MRNAAVEFRASVLTADVIPLVDIIQVLMLGTVSMVRPPIKKEMITIPKLKIPFDANQPNFSNVSSELDNSCW